MKRPAKIRHQLYLDADLSERRAALAAKPGISKSAILADALKALLTTRATHELDDRFGQTLDRASLKQSRIERDQQVIMETLALFVRYFLTINAPLPESDQAARAVGATASRLSSIRSDAISPPVPGH